MEEERRNSSVGGRSMIALIVPNSAGVGEGDANYASQIVQILREEIPDLRILFLGGGTINRFNNFVQDNQRDLFQVRPASGPADTAIMSTVSPVVQRIQQVPRRVINHRCGSNWQTSERGQNSMNAHTDPNGIVFYRVHPNYFFGATDTRRIRIQGQNRGTITVCESRSVENPRANSTAGGSVNCRQITSESYDINLQNACDGAQFIHHCQPLFFSVEGAQQLSGPATVNMICIDAECQFPDSQRFVIHAENLDCRSGVSKMVGTLLPIFLSVFWVFSRFV